MRKRTIGIFGGSFDPPHLGHLEIAVKARLLVDELWIVPCGHRPDKPFITPYQIRYQMCAAAFKGFKIEDIEKAGPIIPTFYLIKTLEKLYPEVQFYSVIGKDLLKDIIRWDEGERLVNEVTFLVFNRPGIVFPDEVNNYFSQKNFIEANQPMENEVSSTWIRNRIKEEREIGAEKITERIKEIIGLPEISELIVENNLYV